MQNHFCVENSIGVANQCLPIACGTLKHLTFGNKLTTFAIIDSLLIDGHHTDTGTGLNRHIADCHAPFDGHVTEHRTGELDRVFIAASGANLADNG